MRMQYHLTLYLDLGIKQKKNIVWLLSNCKSKKFLNIFVDLKNYFAYNVHYIFLSNVTSVIHNNR